MRLDKRLKSLEKQLKALNDTIRVYFAYTDMERHTIKQTASGDDIVVRIKSSQETS